MKRCLLLLLLTRATLAWAEPLSIDRESVLVQPGPISFAGGQDLRIAMSVTIPIAPSPLREVKDEPVKLSAVKPEGFGRGTKLKGCNAHDTNARGSLVKGSLQIRRTAGGELLKVGEDYLVDEDWAMVGVGPSGKVTPEDTVYASYQVSLLRLDTVQVWKTGEVRVKAGEPHISTPLPAVPDPGWFAVAHVLRPYHGTPVTQAEYYPILETSAQAVTGTTRGRIPKTLAKLKAGEPVKIVCLGDSVTAGGNASKPEFRYVDVFERGLREQFPKAKLEVLNLSAGGSNSGQWLNPEKNPYRGLKGAENPARFERVLEAKPDLLTIEFVNDAGLSGARLEAQYTELLKRIEPLGTEVIFITPHFTMWSMMGFKEMREVEKRPYVLSLRKFANDRNIAIADASARWEHLWKEGLPYITLLHNTINHPDDRGHRLFAEELWRCFEDAPAGK